LRRFLIDETYRIMQQITPIVIGGQTGCGKRLTISKSVFQAVNRSWTDNTIAQRKMINYDLQRKIIITQKTKERLESEKIQEFLVMSSRIQWDHVQLLTFLSVLVVTVFVITFLIIPLVSSNSS
jgi:hypothetical protein